MRKLVALVVVALLVVVDRVAVGLAEGQIADRVQASQDLPERPSVGVAGFPFLTQVVRGRYKQVGIEARGLEREGLRLDDVRVDAEGVRVDLGDLISGTVNSAPVDHARGEVLVTYDDLNAYLARRVQLPRLMVARSGSDLKVTGTVEIPLINQPISLSGNAAVSIAGENVTLFPTVVEAATGFLPDFAQGPAKEALTIRFRLGELPLGVRLDSARVTEEGIRFSALGDGLTLDTR